MTVFDEANLAGMASTCVPLSSIIEVTRSTANAGFFEMERKAATA